MEVASPPPLPFGHGSAGTKRHFPGSPAGFVDHNSSTSRSPFAMIPGDSSDEYTQQRSFKRRRFTSADESMGADTENTQNHSFLQFQSSMVGKTCSSPASFAHGKLINRLLNHVKARVFSRFMTSILSDPCRLLSNFSR
jgi:hypothetical protein